MDALAGGAPTAPPPGAVGPAPTGPPGAGPPGGAPPSIEVEEGPPEGAGGGSPLEILRDAIAGLQDYIAADHDEEDKAEGTKALAILQRVLARNQKQQMGGPGDGEAARTLRRALSG
jgi:hypothetical protein